MPDNSTYFCRLGDLFEAIDRHPSRFSEADRDSVKALGNRRKEYGFTLDERRLIDRLLDESPTEGSIE